MIALFRPPVQFLMAILVTLMAVASPPPAAAADRAKVEAFLHVTGFDVALESLKFSAEDAPQMLGIDAGVFGYSWTRLSSEIFDVDVMRDMAVDILEQALEDDKLAFAADFYASDLGQRLVAVENASHMDPDSDGKKASGQAILAELQADNDPRLDLLDRMGDAVGSTDTAIRAIQQIQLRFLLAASAAGVIELRYDQAELEALLKEQESEMRQSIEASGLAASAHVYQDFSDSDLLAYIEALEHPAMRAVYELMNAIQYEIQANRFEALALRMSELNAGQDI